MDIETQRFQKELLVDSSRSTSASIRPRDTAELKQLENRRDFLYHPHLAAMSNATAIDTQEGSDLFIPVYQPSLSLTGLTSLGTRIRNGLWNLFTP
jgi:hypothetical protein